MMASLLVLLLLILHMRLSKVFRLTSLVSCKPNDATCTSSHHL
jgi:hypothetical protein